MSYALELTEPALDDLIRLDVWLQEETLDELDRLALDPPIRRRRIGDFVHDFVRRGSGGISYVFVTFSIHAASGVRSIATYFRPPS